MSLSISQVRHNRPYKAWRATVTDELPDVITTRPAPGMVFNRLTRMVVVRSRRPLTLTPTERARNAVKSFWQTLTPEQRSERQRKAAKKMWKRRRAEAR